MKIEYWKPIPGYEEYEVSNLGRVRSLKFGKMRILKTVIQKVIYTSHYLKII